MVKHDSKASLNASHDELNNWQDIVIQEQLVVHPHSGSARVNMTLRNNGELETKDNEDGSNCDPIFEVFSVEVRPYSCVHVDDNNLNIAPGNPFKSIDVESAGNTPISCISAATEVEQIAIICVENDKVHVSVWDYSKIQTQSGDDKHPFFDEKPKVVKDIYCEDGVSKLPLGISLSPDGKQLAVFQEPEIGDWGAGAAVKEATFKFQLISLDNSVSKSGPGNTEACSNWMASSSFHNAGRSSTPLIAENHLPNDDGINRPKYFSVA
ncbi:hypothetical protein BGX20_011360 [Mortierella sp. AD010]|nr:hypothetical protein BGX20_011360 [Mortierella sp. AD010]